MYRIIAYKDKNGNEPITEYIESLAGKADKDSRIKLNKILDYID
jgi:phage-related protein